MSFDRARCRGLPLVVTMLLSAGLAASSASAAPRHAVALHGAPALDAAFAALPYVNADAPKGGRLTLGQLGSFDSLNPLIVKGVPVAGVREFSVESLMARGLDEPFTLYGLLAETIDIADDGLSVTFALNPKARFSDRTPLTADDVLHSFALLKTRGRPNHRTYFEKVAVAEKLSDHQVRFVLADARDRELPLILGLMPIFARHATPAETFDLTTMTPLLGTGPYTISRVDAGRSLTYTRDADYWGRDLPINRGRFNFDEIRFDYYREGSVMIEAFKRGAIDLRLEEDPSRWAGGYDFDAARDGRVIKSEFEIGLPAGMTGLVFNTRRSVFQNAEVRRALIALFDFEWVNRTLFSGLYRRTASFFERSMLSSVARPADETERALLAPFADAVRPDVRDGTAEPAKSDGSGQNRANQKAAFEILTKAGYVLDGGQLVDPKTNQQLAFEILANNSAQEALLLAYARSLEPLGIKVSVRVVDSAQYQSRLTTYDYDMIQATWPSSLSPGNEQLFRWSSKAASNQGTYNFAGVANPAVDAMIDAMLAADTAERFTSSVRALDRVLRSGHYVIPLFHVPRQWVAYWSRLKHPEKTPVFGYALDTWWVEETR